MNLNDHLCILDPAQAGQSDAECLQGLLEQVHNEPFESPQVRPAWRLYLLPPLTASSDPVPAFRSAFACSHALADGISGILFHSTFLQALRAVSDVHFDSKPIWNVPRTGQLLPPLDRAALFPISWSFLLGPLLAEYLPPMLARALGVSSNISDDVWTGALVRPQRPTPPQLLRTAIRFTKVPRETCQHVLAVCRTHKVRLTGVLAVLTARALAAALRARRQEYNTLKAQTAIDLRRCLPTHQGSMSNCVSAVSELLTVSPLRQDTSAAEPMQDLTSTGWAIAHGITECLSQASSSLADQPVALLKYLSNFRDWTLRQAGKPSDASFSVSNVGVFDNDIPGSAPHSHADQPRWSAEEMVFSQSADATGAPFNINVVSTKHGSLAITASWWPGMLGVEDEASFMEGLCSDIERQLRIIGSGTTIRDQSL